MGPRFVYEGGPSENPFSDTEGKKIESAKQAETVSEYDSTADKNYYDGIIKGKVDAKKTEMEGKIDADMKAIKDDDPDKDKKVAALEAIKKDLPNKLAEYKKQLEAARDASLGKISEAVKARNTEIKEEAKKFRESIVLEMEAHDVEQRQQHPDSKPGEKAHPYNWNALKTQVKSYGKEGLGYSYFQKDVAMQQFGEEGQNTHETENWTRDMQVDMVTETIQTIYEERGEEEAKAMVAKLKEMRGNEKHNWFTYNSAFRGTEYMKSGDEDSAFKFVHSNMGAPVDKPKAFGHILGKMYSADKYFSEKGAPEAFKAYQAYVQKQMKDHDYMKAIDEGSNEQDIMSPSQWLKEHGSDANLKEVLQGREKDRDKFVENIVKNIKLTEGHEDLQGVYLTQIRSVLKGAMWASNDPKEWDRIARQTLAKMMGGNFDTSKMNVNDILVSKFVADASKEYGDNQVHQMIGVQGMAFVAGLLDGAEQMYGEKNPEFLKKYKKMVKEKFSDDSKLMDKVRKQLAVFQANGKVLATDPEAQEIMKKLLDDDIRAAYNYYEDLGGDVDKKKAKENRDALVAAKKKYDDVKAIAPDFTFEELNSDPSKLGDKEAAEMDASDVNARLLVKINEYIGTNKDFQSTNEDVWQNGNMITVMTAKDSRAHAMAPAIVPIAQKLKESYDAQVLTLAKDFKTDNTVEAHKHNIALWKKMKEAVDTWKKANANDIATVEKHYPKVDAANKRLGVDVGTPAPGDEGKTQPPKAPAPRPAPQPGGGAPKAAPKPAPSKAAGDLDNLAKGDGGGNVEFADAKPEDIGKPVKLDKIPETVQKKVAEEKEAGTWRVTYKEGDEKVTRLVKVDKKNDEKKQDYFELKA